MRVFTMQRISAIALIIFHDDPHDRRALPAIPHRLQPHRRAHGRPIMAGHRYRLPLFRL